MLTLVLLGIAVIIALAVVIYWLLSRTTGKRPEGHILDESIDTNRSRGERVDG
ncbi:MAG: hypothetical protein WBW04_10385 [Nitrolancea sp.]